MNIYQSFLEHPFLNPFFILKTYKNSTYVGDFLILKHQVHSTLEGECYDPQQFSNRLKFEGSVSLGPLYTRKLSKIYSIQAGLQAILLHQEDFFFIYLFTFCLHKK